ncbi:MAG: hypothetical protein H7X77_10080 [Anaerolineae bacterium]|nr:hypothetical protein [Anaerolineae bacterium]
MPHYQSFDPKAEIIGQTALSLITNIMHDDIAGILKRHDLEQIDPAAWYPIQSVLDVLSEISEGENASSAFVSIGMAAGKLGYDSLPDAVKQMSLGDFLVLYSKHYQSRMRNGDAGWIKVEQRNERHSVIQSCIPFPDDVFYGVFYAYARLYRPAGKGFTVKYDEQLVRHDDGGEFTTLHVLIDA